MATKPSVSTDWATDGGALKLDTTSVQKTRGWDTDDGTTDGVPEKPTLQHQNGWQSNVNEWVDYYEVVTDQLALSSSPAGIIQAFGGSSAPTGWLECDGAAVSRTTYSDLFAEIGTTFGVGNGSTTFNLPISYREDMIGWKEYDSSDVTITSTGWSSIGEFYFTPYKTKNGENRIRFNFEMSKDAGTSDSVTFAINVVFRTGIAQAVSIGEATVGVGVQAFTNGGGGNLSALRGSTSQFNNARISGDVSLDSFPGFADTPTFAVIKAFPDFL